MGEQMSLTMEYVDLSPEEQIERGKQLAARLRHRAAMLEEHKDRKKEMREDLEAVEAEIAHYAEIVRQAREERPVGTRRG